MEITNTYKKYIGLSHVVTNHEPIDMNTCALGDCILTQNKHVRLVLWGGRYSIQVRWRWRWRTVCFGPFGPYPIGLSHYKIFNVAYDDYFKCKDKPKSYFKRGLKTI